MLPTFSIDDNIDLHVVWFICPEVDSYPEVVHHYPEVCADVKCSRVDIC